jgi:biopolymer transport protein ExbD
LAKKIHKTGPVAPEMNITPLIDVVFLLIIFFMLVSRIVAEEREPMIVPRLENPAAEKLNTEQRIVVNVARRDPAVTDRRQRLAGDGGDGHLRGPGEAAYVKVGLKRYSFDELDAVTERLRAAKEKQARLQVLLRADAGLFYEQVSPVMQAITAAQVTKVNLVAYTKAEPF